MNKYRAQPTIVDGIRFASKREAARYMELRLLERAGEIHQLEVQPRFPLHVGGVRIGHYVGDFRYYRKLTSGGPTSVVEDVKSPATRTALYKWKKKHTEAEHGIAIVEV